MSTINQRIEQIISNANITVKEFARIAGVPQTTLNEAATKNKDIRFSLLEKIFAVSDNLNANWLITGQGSMYNESTTHRGSSISITGDNNVSQSLSGNGKIGSLNIETKNTSVLEERVAQLEKQIEQLEQDKAFLQDLVSMQKEKIDMLTKNR